MRELRCVEDVAPYNDVAKFCKATNGVSVGVGSNADAMQRGKKQRLGNLP